MEEELSAKEKAAIIRSLFERYRRGETSQAENEVVESLESSIIPQKKFKITDELIDELDDEITDFIFQKIGKPKKHKFSPAFIGSAAGIALLIIGIFVFYRPQHQQTEDHEREYTAIDAIENITLSDGSEIILNSGTTLRERAREVWLDEGEAFFNVKPDATHPFIVHLHNGITVRVLGTSFTILSYMELPFQEISVLSGKVNVSTQHNQSMELITNQQARYGITEKKLSKESTNSTRKAAWRKGTIVLENATADELRLRIRQLYHKNVVFESQPETMSINMTLDKTSAISEIADEIAALYDLYYRITDNKIVFQSINVTELP